MLNNPLRYTDPSGHCPTCLGGAAIGALALGAFYALTTDNFSAGKLIAVMAIGAGAGALIGTGIGAAAGTAAVSAQVAAIATGAGIGMGSASLSSLAQNVGNDLDIIDFTVESVGGGITGAANAAATAFGYPVFGAESILGRGAISGIVGAGEYYAKEVLHGNTPALSGIGNEFTRNVAESVTADMFTHLAAGITPKQLFTGAIPGQYLRPNSSAQLSRELLRQNARVTTFEGAFTNIGTTLKEGVFDWLLSNIEFEPF